MTEFRKTGAPPQTDQEITVSNSAGTKQWHAPEEAPVAFVYNRRNYAVMLASPSDMEDFAIGFSLTERIVDAADEIGAVEIHQSERGIELHMAIDPARLERLDIRQQRRNMVGRAGCGVCGLENADVFFETLPRVSETKAEVSPEALERALVEIETHQPLNLRTRSVHGAAWASFDGAVQLVREDIGRHNALDKLLGALVREGADMQAGFVLMSSRCSYELIEKSARLGVRALAAVSGPTAFAIRKAREANIALYCRDGSGFVEV